MNLPRLLRPSRRVLLASFALGFLLGGCATAPTTDPALLDPDKNSALKPAPRDPNWIKRHEGFVEIAKHGGVAVLFLGDSITDFWRRDGPQGGKSIWERDFAPLRAANFGISGDRTQHVLWRMANGELTGLQPKVVVLMIGTNNTGLERNTNAPRNTGPETIQGVTAVVKGLRARLPATRVLLLAIFPRADNPVSPPQIREINAALAKLDDRKFVRFLDINAKLLNADGVLTKDIMPDLLHPNAKGYEIWAAAIRQPLAEMLK